jgi:hypothetical protein
MQKVCPSVRPPAFSWPLTVRGCGSRWSRCQRINNDLIRKAGGSFAAVEALDFQQHHTQERPGPFSSASKTRRQLIVLRRVIGGINIAKETIGDNAPGNSEVGSFSHHHGSA